MRCSERGGDLCKVTQLVGVTEPGDAIWASGSDTQPSLLCSQEAHPGNLLCRPSIVGTHEGVCTNAAPGYTYVHLDMHTHGSFHLLVHISCVCLLVCMCVVHTHV